MVDLQLRKSVVSLCALAMIACATTAFAATSYTVTNLVSDVAGLAAMTDPALKNAWGLDRGPGGPWWVNSNGNGTSRVYDGTGAPGLVVLVQGVTSGTTSKPTGLAFNGTTNFEVTPGNPAVFLFATEDGTIAAWNPVVLPKRAVIKINNSSTGAVYKGITLGAINSAPILYVANFHAATVEAYDPFFRPITLPAGAFTDPMIPAGFAPFNVQSVNGQIYVAFAKQDEAGMDDVPGPGMGYVSVFTNAGKLVHRLQYGGWMNAPWGISLAPSGFGDFSGMVLVGQFGSGAIIAFDATTGAITGIMRDSTTKAIIIPGLWGLNFADGGPAGPANALYFTAGIDDEAHGLFGSIQPNP
jgi:uncharacterized protein (TIGR03118 family)